MSVEDGDRGAQGALALLGVAEIAEVAGMTRQAVTNLRARDPRFPAPVAELRSGPVFRERDVRSYLETRGRRVAPRTSEAKAPLAATRFDPLSKISLARSVERALLEQPPLSMADVHPFAGGGLYCIYYGGSYEPYKPLLARPLEFPLYVGRGSPHSSGLDSVLEGSDEPALYNRIRGLARSIRYVEEYSEAEGDPSIRLADFSYRFLVVDDMWGALAEELLMAHFAPLWNTTVRGFGFHDPGGGRSKQSRSDWDQLHPGRPWALRLPPSQRSVEEILSRVAGHLGRLSDPDFRSLPY